MEEVDILHRAEMNSATTTYAKGILVICSLTIDPKNKGIFMQERVEEVSYRLPIYAIHRMKWRVLTFIVIEGDNYH
jgi:hypothetical protein